MKLATAFVEIAARTDVFRRQLDEARALAETAAAGIRSAFEPPPRLLPDPVAEDLPSDRREPDLVAGRGEAQRTSRPAARETASPPNAADILADLWRGSLPEISLPAALPAGTALAESPAEPGRGASPGGEATGLLRQQLDLHRRTLDVLNRQLEALQAIRGGVPAVLT
jgi:hypothetical protein